MTSDDDEGAGEFPLSRRGIVTEAVQSTLNRLEHDDAMEITAPHSSEPPKQA